MLSTTLITSAIAQISSSKVTITMHPKQLFIYLFGRFVYLLYSLNLKFALTFSTYLLSEVSLMLLSLIILSDPNYLFRQCASIIMAHFYFRCSTICYRFVIV